ncbi:hypothetical protein [Aquimarina algiphila]|uniref:hypothetical protein n=1 Tax=Aquimarina algiphila TaxID=2047982 RepID=UPI00249005B4|nr:hypothetical protein [Aquimarina algiphila]
MKYFLRYKKLYRVLVSIFLLLNIEGSAQEKLLKNIISDTTYHTSLDITEISGNLLSVTYKTLPGNQSGQLQNKLWVWRASEVPWKYAPMAEQFLPKDATESGSYVIENLKIAIDTKYIVCYSVGAEVTQICTCTTLDGNTKSFEKRWVSIKLIEVNQNSISFTYETLSGYLPKTYNNWFGVWEGEASPYNLTKALAKGTPSDDSNINQGSLTNLSMDIGQTYTFIYFVGSEESQAASIIRFTMR